MIFRYFFITSFLLTVSGVVAYIFWSEEVRYSLPTPIPVNYKAVSVTTTIELKEFGFSEASAKYLHFYNPDCPCSRFNAKHIKELIKAHGDSIEAYIVVPSKGDVKAVKREFGEALQLVVDDDSKIAGACGVYATPQAVIIDHQQQLFYRGNYNQARYCTTKATNYAELALVSLINGASPPVFGLSATQSYGCSWQSSTQLLFN
jgi:hypothetical protein